jgi:hypothetical protein
MWVECKLVLVRLETVLISVQDRYTICAKCATGMEKCFWAHWIELPGDVGQVEARFDTFGDSVNLGT